MVATETVAVADEEHRIAVWEGRERGAYGYTGLGEGRRRGGTSSYRT